MRGTTTILVLAVMAGLLAGLACGSPDQRAGDAATAAPERGTPSPAVATSPSAAPRGTPVALASGTRRLAFVSDRDGALRLYTMNPDGSDVRRVSDQPVSQGPYSVSNDGTQVVATGPEQDEASARQVFRIDVAGGTAQLIGTLPATDSGVVLTTPVWEPDDGYVLVQNLPICYAVPSGGGEPRERDGSECFDALAVAAGPGDQWAAVAGEKLVAGRGPVTVTGAAANVRELDRIVDSSAQEGPAALLLLALQVSGASRPVWSPDGKLLAYVDADTPDGRTGVSIITADGSGGPRLLVPFDQSDLLVPGVWSDDGRLLYFSGFGEGPAIRVVDTQTGEVRSLVGDDGSTYLYPRWVVEAAAPQRTPDTSSSAAQLDELKRELAKAPGRLLYGGQRYARWLLHGAAGRDRRAAGHERRHVSIVRLDRRALALVRGAGWDDGGGGHDDGRLTGI